MQDYKMTPSLKLYGQIHPKLCPTTLKGKGRGGVSFAF